MQRLMMQCLFLAMTALLSAGCADYSPRKKPGPAAVQPQSYYEKKAPTKKNSPPQSEKKLAVTDKKDPTSFEVDGWGKTQEESKEHAVRKASEMIKTRLDPPLLWTPPVDFILKNLLTGESKRRHDQDVEDVVKGQKMLSWTWTFRLPAAQVEFMRREDAKYRAELAAKERSVLADDRMQDLLKVVALLVLAQAGVWLLVRAFSSRK